MCMFCAAIPMTAAASVNLNKKQRKSKQETQAAEVEKSQTRPVMQVTVGVVVLLLIGSVTYHTLAYLP